MISPNKEKTTPERVDEALDLAFRCKMNLAKCAEHCGMTIREFKMTFREYIKHIDVEETYLQPAFDFTAK